MRLRHYLVCLLLLSGLAAGTASAAVRASGFSCAAAGGASVASSLDGRALHLSGLDLPHSGFLLDGADVALTHLDGHHIRSSSTWATSDAGTVCSYSWGASNPTTVGSGGLSQGRCVMQRTPSGVALTLDLSQFGTSPTKTCALYLENALVTSFQCPSNFDLVASSPTCAVMRVPEVALEFGQRGPRQTTSLSISSECALVISANGASFTCDRIVMFGDCDDRDDFSLVSCAVRVATTSPTSASTFDIESQGAVKFGIQIDSILNYADDPGLPEQALGSELSLSPGIVSNSPWTMVVSSSVVVYGGLGDGPGGAFDSNGAPLHITPRDAAPASLEFSRARPFTLDPATDEGAALGYSLRGTGGCSPTAELASVSLEVSNHQVVVVPDFSAMCADVLTAVVSSRGQPVGQFSLALSSVVAVLPPPGGSPVCSGGKAATKSSSNIQNNLVAPGGGMSASVQGSTGSPSGAGDRSRSYGSVDPRLSLPSTAPVSLGFGFVDQREFHVGPVVLLGDEIIFTGQRSSPPVGSPSMTVTGTQFSLRGCSSGSCGSGSSSLHVIGLASHRGDEIFADIPATVSISSSTPVVSVPVLFERTNTKPVRGISVTIRHSSNVLMGPIPELDYLSRSGQTQKFDVVNPDGSHTVDIALLGAGCGPTTSGRLFSIPLQRAPGAPDGLAFVSIDAVEVADCSGGPVPASPGGKAFIVLDGSPPPPVSALTATQVKSGNDASGTTRISLSFTQPDPTASVELYRTAFGNYPEYDDGANPGSVPTLPSSYPPPARWSRVNASSCGGSTSGVAGLCDQPSSRDVHYYICYSVDRAGNFSPVSSMTSGTLSYHLGDVAGGGNPCAGDNRVGTGDISALGASYGATFPVGSPLSCLDVGPTRTGTVDGQPLTDHRLSFRDLLIYAINYSIVSMPAGGAQPLAASSDALRLRVPSLPGVGQTFEVALEMSGAGDAQGVSAQLAFDPAVVEALGTARGELLARQGREAVVFSAQPGNVDAALLGVGGGIAGEGELARLTFRVKAPGDPALRIAAAEGRDAQNRELLLGGIGVTGGASGHTALRLAFPNPFYKSTTVVLSLREQGPASVRVYDVAGRTVRTLLNSVQPAGERVLAWDGRDDSGTPLGAGVYMLRLEAGGHRETRAVRLVK